MAEVKNTAHMKAIQTSCFQPLTSCSYLSEQVAAMLYCTLSTRLLNNIVYPCLEQCGCMYIQLMNEQGLNTLLQHVHACHTHPQVVPRLMNEHGHKNTVLITYTKHVSSMLLTFVLLSTSVDNIVGTMLLTLVN